MKNFVRFLMIFILTNDCAFSANAQMIRQLFEGPPEIQTQYLDESAYASFTAKKLARGRVAYVNFTALEKILKKMGYDEPPTHLTPELAREIMEYAGYAVPADGEESADYVDQFTTLYADKYGGTFLNGNFGSARAGSRGKVQVKGIGRTPLLRPNPSASHASGNASMVEAINEAIWSEILDEELPLGANPVLFIIDTGIKIHASFDAQGDRALIIRADPLRPAHFQSNSMVNYEEDHHRVEHVLKRLLEAVPLPPNYSTSIMPQFTAHEKLRVGLNEFIDRVALQYAAAYTHSLYHGATSTSNIQFNGGFLDYGTQTSVDGFSRIRLLKSEQPNGDTLSFKTDLLYEFYDDLRDQLPDNLKTAVPTHEQIDSRFDGKFEKDLHFGMLLRAGAPPEVLEKIKESPIAEKLAKTLLEIVQAGNTEVIDSFLVPLNTGTYDLTSITLRLARTVNSSVDVQQRYLKKYIADDGLRNRLIVEFREFKAALETAGAPLGVSKIGLSTYMREALLARNKKMLGIRRDEKIWKSFDDAAGAFHRTDDPHFLQKFIETHVQNNLRVVKSEPFTLKVVDSSLISNGLIQYRTTDLRTGVTEVTKKIMPGFRAEKKGRNASPCKEDLAKLNI